MTRRRKDPPREPTSEERRWLARISRSHAEPASHVARAKALLAVADGQSYIEAANARGRGSGDAVSNLVSRFNREGMAAIEPGHGGGPTPIHESEERERILAEARRDPDREKDGTAEWSLTTPRRKACEAPPTDCPRFPPTRSGRCRGGRVLAGRGPEAGARPWRETGRVKRKRKSGGVVEVADPDAEARNFDRTRLWGRREAVGFVGVGHRPGRTFPDGTLSRVEMADGRQARPPASPAHKKRHGEADEPVPSGYRGSTGKRGS